MMRRITHVFITSAFAVACLGLWLLVTIIPSFYPSARKIPNYKVPDATQWMLNSKPLLLIAAGAAILFCVYSFKRASADTNILLGAIYALVLAIFFAVIALTILMPWIVCFD